MTDVHEDIKVATPEEAAEARRVSGMPPEFVGRISIDWPQTSEQGQVMHGWKTRIRDERGYDIYTVLDAAVHVNATGWVWADLKMYAGRDGKPIMELPADAHAGAAAVPVNDDGEPITGHFPFLVTSMRVKGQ